MIGCTLICKEEHVDKMDVSAFDKHFANIKVAHDLYDEVGVIFVSLEDEIGDYCFIEDRILYLILHVAPSTEAMIEAFERNYFQPAETQE
jgi:hypothetical protein